MMATVWRTWVAPDFVCQLGRLAVSSATRTGTPSRPTSSMTAVRRSRSSEGSVLTTDAYHAFAQPSAGPAISQLSPSIMLLRDVPQSGYAGLLDRGCEKAAMPVADQPVGWA